MDTRRKSVSAVAALLLIAGMAGIFASSDGINAASNEGTYEIPMFVGDSFSYTPQTLLSGTTIAATGDGLTSNGGWLTFSNGTLSGTASAAGNRIVVLTGTWSNGGLSQVITQTINFEVYDHTTITSTSYNSGAVVGEEYTYSLTYEGNGEETVSVSNLPSWMTWNASANVLSGTPTSGFAGTSPSVTLTVSNAVTGDSDSIMLNLTVYADVAFTSTAPTAVINTTAYAYDVTTSSTPDIAVSVIGTLPSWLTWDDTTNTLSGTPDLTITGQYVDVQVTLRASSAALDRYVDQEITIRIWANNDFAVVPTIDMVTSASTLIMTLTATTTGADMLHIEYGDGTDTYADPSADITHEYAEAGTYIVRGTASNEFGSDSMVVMFEATDGDDGNGGSADGERGSWERFTSNGTAVIAAAVGVIALLAYAFGMRHVTIIAVAVTALLLAGGCVAADIDLLGEMVL